MTTAIAFITGLTTSLHCVGMCGPIACGLGTMAKSEGERMVASTVYHGCRLASYATIGAICGAIGRQPLLKYFASPAALLPWVMVLILLMMAFGIDKVLPRPAFLAKLTTRARLRAMRWPAWASAATMGLLTPFLPCGPLYLVFGIALVAGSAAGGAELMLAFGFGTVPLLWLTQQSFASIRRRLSPRHMAYLQRGLALVAALVLAVRLHGTIPSFHKADVTSPAAQEETQELPSCCHGE